MSNDKIINDCYEMLSNKKTCDEAYEAETTQKDVSYTETDYNDYFNSVLLLEQPFYRTGMTDVEALIELEYLNNNLKSFFEGDYKPLWKQSVEE